MKNTEASVCSIGASCPEVGVGSRPLPSDMKNLLGSIAVWGGALACQAPCQLYDTSAPQSHVHRHTHRYTHAHTYPNLCLPSLFCLKQCKAPYTYKLESLTLQSGPLPFAF